jgi:hypothetical protein
MKEYTQATKGKTLADINRSNQVASSSIRANDVFDSAVMDEASYAAGYKDGVADSTSRERTIRKLENTQKFPHQLTGVEGGKGSHHHEVEHAVLSRALNKRLRKVGVTRREAERAVQKGNQKSGGQRGAAIQLK